MSSVCAHGGVWASLSGGDPAIRVRPRVYGLTLEEELALWLFART